MRALRRLREAAADEPRERVDERRPLAGGEAREDVGVDAIDDLLGLVHLPPPRLRHLDHAGAAVLARGAAPGEASGLELVEGHHHRRLVDPHPVREVDLRVLAAHRGGEEAVGARRDADALERRRDLGPERVARLREEPTEVGAERLGRLARVRRLLECGLRVLHGHLHVLNGIRDSIRDETISYEIIAKAFRPRPSSSPPVGGKVDARRWSGAARDTQASQGSRSRARSKAARSWTGSPWETITRSK